MAKKNSFSWTQNRKAKLKKTVEQFNRQIYREVKAAQKRGELESVTRRLPTPITQKKLMQNIKTQADFDRIIRMYNRFNPKKDWVATEAKKLQLERSKRDAAVRERFSPLKGNTQRARDEGFAYAESDLSKKNKRQLERYIDVQLNALTDAGQHRKDEQYRQNFFTRIHEMEGISDKQRRILENFLRAVDLDHLRELWYDSQSLHVGYTYAPPGEHKQAAANMIEELSEFINKWESSGDQWYTNKYKFEYNGPPKGKFKDKDPITKLYLMNPLIHTKNGIKLTYPTKKK